MHMFQSSHRCRNRPAALADAGLARRYSRASDRKKQNVLASPNSVKLFTAWAAKHKEVIAIEDRFDIAVRADPAQAEALRQELERARVDAQRMLAQAQALFHEELRARGLRQ